MTTVIANKGTELRYAMTAEQRISLLEFYLNRNEILVVCDPYRNASFRQIERIDYLLDALCATVVSEDK